MSKQDKNSIDVYVGNRVKARRMVMGISQTALGEAAGGISFQQIQKYENGVNRISASRLQQIAQCLDVPVSYFFQDMPGYPSGSKTAKKVPEYLSMFLASSEGLALAKDFMRIKSKKLRKCVTDLPKQLAEDQ